MNISVKKATVNSGDDIILSQPDQYTIRLKREDPYTKLSVESNRITLTVTRPE